jgi:hypothetical protein
LAAVAGSASVLSVQTAFGRERGPYARTLNEVEAIWLDSNSCNGGISQQLNTHGFLIAGTPRSSDAVLDVQVNPQDSPLGAAAKYSATLTGEDGRVLFSTSGREDSITHSELCEDIGDDIVDRIENRMG